MPSLSVDRLIQQASFLLRLLVGGLFVYAAWSKLSAPVEEFEAAIRTYEIVPNEYFVHLVASVLPWFELIIGVLLILGVWLRPVLLAHAILLGVFIVLISQGLIRGLDIDCGCFGGTSSNPWLTLLRDVLMLGAIWIQWKWLPYVWSVDGWGSPGVSEEKNNVSQSEDL